MKKMLSYLFLAAGVALLLLFGGCVMPSEFKGVKLATHVLHASQNELHVKLTGTVDHYEYTHFVQSHLYIKANGIKSLHIHLLTPGGGVLAMIGILDMIDVMKADGVHVTTYTNGASMSAGVPIFLKGDIRVMRPNAWLMVHPMGGVVREDVSEETWKVIESWKQVYVDILVEVTTMTSGEAMEALTGDSAKDLTWFNATKALEMKFATVIK